MSAHTSSGDISTGKELVPATAGSGAMFDRIAHRYDRLNRILSMGIDRRWRRRTVASLGLSPGKRALDLATGTADLALDILAAQPGTTVVGVDPSEKMLAVGAQKSERRGFEHRLELEVGVAESLPYADDSFDAITIAFGIRNVPDRQSALEEMARVTRPGGRVAILELSEPRRGLMAPLARFHIHHVVPRIGALLSGAREYRYLQESIQAFPAPDEFEAMMRRAGLEIVDSVSLTFGTCHLFVAEPMGKGASS